MAFWQGASTSVEKVDSVFAVIFALSVLFLVGITATMVFFVFKYSRKRRPKAQEVKEHAWLEITWTLVPLAMFLGMFYFGWTNFNYIRSAPRDAMVVEVTGRQWAWSFKYPNGRQTDQLYAALDKPMKLEIRSADVVHGFFIPAFRLKMDAVPGKVNTTWFQPTQVGSYDIECTVICGVSHTYMLSKVVVVPEEEFKVWYFGPEDAPPPGQAYAKAASALSGAGAAGEPKAPALQILEAKNCLMCHSTDGSPMVGPTFKGIFGSREVVEAGGKEVELVRDEAYLVRAIQDPNAEVVKGYPPAMPEEPLPEGELKEVVEYLKGLK